MGMDPLMIRGTVGEREEQLRTQESLPVIEAPSEDLVVDASPEGDNQL